jgi:hypothetical protein
MDDELNELIGVEEKDFGKLRTKGLSYKTKKHRKTKTCWRKVITLQTCFENFTHSQHKIKQ